MQDVHAEPVEGEASRPWYLSPTIASIVLASAFVIAIGLIVTDSVRARRERYESSADYQRSLAADYRRNAKNSALMIRSAGWHEHLREMYLRAAKSPWISPPIPLAGPPPDWMPEKPDQAKLGRTLAPR